MDHQEAARQEAASKIVHPTLHLPANSQPSTQVVGLFSSSTTSSLSIGSGSSLFNTPSSAPSTTHHYEYVV